MGERSFWEDQAREQTVEAIKAVELETSAELVVSLQWISGSYRHTDYLFGFVLSLATLVFLLFAPWEFALWFFPVDVLVAFVLGVFISAWVTTLRRLLTARSTKRENVRRAARAAFHDLGISRTSGRNGILVYVSMFEKVVEVVTDVGIDEEELGDAWKAACAELGASVRGSPDLDRFIASLRSFGPILGEPMPRAEDDVNELPDEVVAS